MMIFLKNLKKKSHSTEYIPIEKEFNREVKKYRSLIEKKNIKSLINFFNKKTITNTGLEAPAWTLGSRNILTYAIQHNNAALIKSAIKHCSDKNTLKEYFDLACLYEPDGIAYEKQPNQSLVAPILQKMSTLDSIDYQPFLTTSFLMITTPCVIAALKQNTSLKKYLASKITSFQIHDVGSPDHLVADDATFSTKTMHVFYNDDCSGSLPRAISKIYPPETDMPPNVESILPNSDKISRFSFLSATEYLNATLREEKDKFNPKTIHTLQKVQEDISFGYIEKEKIAKAMIAQGEKIAWQLSKKQWEEKKNKEKKERIELRIKNFLEKLPIPLLFSRLFFLFYRGIYNLIDYIVSFPLFLTKLILLPFRSTSYPLFKSTGMLSVLNSVSQFPNCEEVQGILNRLKKGKTLFWSPNDLGTALIELKSMGSHSFQVIYRDPACIADDSEAVNQKVKSKPAIKLIIKAPNLLQKIGATFSLIYTLFSGLFLGIRMLFL